MKTKTLASFALVLLLTQNGCDDAPPPNVTASGVASSEERTLSSFSSVELYGVGTLTVEPGDDPTVVVETDDNMLDHFKTSVSSKKLRVGVGPGTYRWKGYPQARLKSSQADAYSLSGQTSLVLKDVDKESLKIDGEGQCNVVISGQVGVLTVDLAGQCSIDATNATITSVDGRLEEQCTLKYAGDVEVDVDASGASKVEKVEAAPQAGQ